MKKVVVGVSGGVDSAVTALLLKQKGYDVQGVFMKNWDTGEETGVCTTSKDLEDAKWMCDQIKIPFREVNYVKHYWNDVFSHLVSGYQKGLTPNPDILCNRNVKFNHFLNYALNDLQADAVATGHYARTTFGPYLENYQPDTDVHLLEAFDKTKCQAFFLCGIRQKSLRRIMFPLGELRKVDVKEIARNSGLVRLAKKKESMGICFIGKRHFQDFIAEYVNHIPGNFIDVDTGKVVGTHNGIHMWTIGQRTNLSGFSKAYFILKKISPDILVAAGTDHPRLHTKFVLSHEPNWICHEPLELTKNKILECYFRFQHTKPLIPCRIVKYSVNKLFIMLEKSARAITPGQYAVFYKDGECLGGAQIIGPGPSDIYFNGEEL
ncbi:mitochondrial tRNA-specific 2-thiouridylase 1-like [Ctenocephalides felis]|uniref:mitochondrial tRNA-specific 2-thiouridylase 1-like n=1 Tax=Ctenocephalides felis TaxID=7515 RepID=UPI000E6E4A3C|nr:mitochondrial tRNA-specific 2-thiouridylase 1-like [Ctenocephalides felis]